MTTSFIKKNQPMLKFKNFWILSLLTVFINLKGNAQLRDIYENMQFTHGGFINPANIAVDPTINFDLSLFAFQPQSKSIEGLYNSISLLANKALGKNGNIGLLLDYNQNGAFEQVNTAFKYGYLVKLSEKMDIGIGLSAGIQKSTINTASIQDPLNQNQFVPDPVIQDFNNRPVQIYTDLGVNFRWTGLRIQGVYYNITKAQGNTQETQPKYYFSLDYNLELDRIGVRAFGGLVGYDDKVNSNKIIFGFRLFYNPIGFSAYYNTQGKITTNIDLRLINQLSLDLGYVFGPYYSNPVYGDKGNISLGAKYTIFKK